MNAPTIQGRIVIRALIVSLVPLGVLGVQVYSTGRQALEEAAAERVRAVATSRAAWTRDWVAERLADMAVIGRSRDCSDLVRRAHGHPSTDTVCEYLETFLGQTESYEVIELYDLDWNLVAGAGPVHLPAGGWGEALRERLTREKGPVVGALHRHSDDGLGLHLGNILWGPEGSHVGYVVANLDPSRALEPILTAHEGLGSTGRVYIVSAEGDVVTGFGGARPSGDSTDVRAPWPPAHSDTTYTYRGLSGESVIGSWAWMPERGWAIVAEITTAEALGWVRILRRRTLEVAALVGLGVILLSFYIARNLSRPLRSLAAAAARISRGQSHLRVDIRDPTEIGRLGQAFNRMLDSLEIAQERRVQAESLAAVGTLSSSIVHEMRSPLSSVRMNVQALSRASMNEPANSELGQIALEQVDRIERMLHDLLHYGKPVHLEFVAVSVGGLVQEVVRDLRTLGEERGVTTRVVDNTEGFLVALDRDRIQQVLCNLIENAIDASAPGGDVTIESDLAGNGRTNLRIVVRDEGAGIPATVLPRLFQPFASTKDEGVGLGLAVVKKIVDLHGGTVRARNRSGGGAEFEVLLPAGVTSEESASE